jgi:cephalosporin hydroxylase
MPFQDEVAERIAANDRDEALKVSAQAFLQASVQPKYSYNFAWLGRPIIQYPQDIVAMQELVWRLQPDLILETGIAHGGSLVLYASLLELNALCGGPAQAEVLGIDIEIRPHNREAILAHPLARRIRMIEGSSLAPEVIAQALSAAVGKRSVLVVLDSNHTHAHVLEELKAYAPLVTPGGYCVVFDTLIEDMPEDSYPDRPWGPGDNPKTAVRAYLQDHPEFEVDRSIQNKLLITVAPEGYLRRVGP